MLIKLPEVENATEAAVTNKEAGATDLEETTTTEVVDPGFSG